jgi:hypothetical protein
MVLFHFYYRESSSASDLNQAKNDIANIYSTAFNPSRVYIITWDQVALKKYLRKKN